MISPAQYFCIQHEFHTEHRKISHIARSMGLTNRTVAKWTTRSEYTRKRGYRTSKLDAFKATILRLLNEEGLSTMQINYVIRAQGYAGGYSILKDFVKRNPNRPHVDRKEYAVRSWLHRVMQCWCAPAELQGQLGDKLNADEITDLVQRVKTGPLQLRNKAVAVFAFARGISTRLIARFLLLREATVSKWRKGVKAQGMAAPFAPRPGKGKRSELPEVKEAVFSILHAPPSEYGFNRTSWRMEDIVQTLRSEGIALCKDGVLQVIRKAGYRFRQAKKVLTSNDPDYRQKLQEVTNILCNLKSDEKFFSVDEFGPFAVKRQGGRSRTRPDELRSVPQYQRSKGSLILIGALELSENQITHFFSEKKNTEEMLKLLDILVLKYADQTCIYFSWDAASWHASKRFLARVEEINSAGYRATHRVPLVKLAPLPSCAQFLNVIESVFSGMARAIIHNSDYESVEECKASIERYFAERNQHFAENPKRAGNKIWGQERVPPAFKESNNCKDPRYQNRGR